MAPPQYGDLGKSAKDLFNKGYSKKKFFFYFFKINLSSRFFKFKLCYTFCKDYGTVKLDVKTKTQNGIDFNLTGEHNTDIQKSLGTLEAKYFNKANGLTFVEKWNTDNILKSELTLEDNLVKGLKLVLDTSYAPASGLVTIKTFNFSYCLYSGFIGIHLFFYLK